MQPDEKAEAVRAWLEAVADDLEKVATERGVPVSMVAAEVIMTYRSAASAGMMRAKPG